MKRAFNISNAQASVIGSSLASFGAILASSCCVIPIALFNLGVGGAWLANLAVLQPYRIHFIGVALLIFCTGIFLSVRSKQKTEGTCRLQDGERIKRTPLLFSISAMLIAAAIIWPQVEPNLLRAIR